jgi:hypothetical protein
VAAPVLYIGPTPSDPSEMLDGIGNGYLHASAAHGELNRVVQHIQWVRRAQAETKRQVPAATCSLFSKEKLLPKLVAELEAV